MVTSYYIMKMAEKKTKIDINEYYQSLLYNFRDERLLKNFKGVYDDDQDERCRVCLAKNSAKIYGRKNTKEIVDALHIFGVLLSEDDSRKRLCVACLKFLDAAIMFKHIVRHSEQILRQHFKEEPNIEDQTFENCNQYSINDDFDYDSPQNNNAEPSKNEGGVKVKNNKKESVKLNPKVTCQVCNKVINRSYYKEHLTMHDPNHQKYICDVCGKSFRLRCAYHNHSLRHRSDFPYKCKICPYRGRYSELLKTHARTHTGDYRYMCTECPARFLFKSNLNSHMLKHKEPQYKCNNCKRAFHTKLVLERHFQADHLGVKNHVCNLCGKAFGYRNAMMKHQIHVHKREKFMFGRMPSYLQAEHKVQEIYVAVIMALEKL